VWTFNGEKVLVIAGTNVGCGAGGCGSGDTKVALRNG